MKKIKMRNHWLLALLKIFTTFCFFSSTATFAVEAEKPPFTIYASILPQIYIIKAITKIPESISPERFKVIPLVKPGESEEAYQLTIQERSELGMADLYFSIGLPFEKALIEKLDKDNKGLKIIETDKNIPLIPMTCEDACCKTHDNHDPHFWLDPLNMKIMAKTITEALCQKDPLFSKYYQDNLIHLQAELSALHATLTDLLTPVKSQTIVTVHPSYGYLAKTYGLKQIAIEKDGKEPTPKSFQALIEFIKKNNIHTLFSQPNFSSKSAEALVREINHNQALPQLKIVMIDPLMEDYPKGMEAIAIALRDGLEK